MSLSIIQEKRKAESSRHLGLSVKKQSRIMYRTRSVMEAATATAVMMRGSITLFLSPLERSRRAVVVLLLFV